MQKLRTESGKDMNQFSIFTINELIETADTDLDVTVSFDCQLDVTEDEETLSNVVRVSHKSNSDYVSLDDVMVHIESDTMFMYYETFIERFCQSQGMSYNGNYRLMYDGNGALSDIAIEIID